MISEAPEPSSAPVRDVIVSPDGTASAAPSERGLPTSVLVGAMGVLVVCGFCGVAFAPYLVVHYPLGLVALNPLWRHLILASPNVDALSFFLVATVRMFLPDPFMYEIGRRFGPRALDFMEAQSPSAGRFLRVLERLFSRAGLFVLFLNPTLSVCALAGVAKIPYGRFVVINVLGTLMQLTLIRLLGEAFSEPIQLFLGFVSRHMGAFMLASLGFAFVSWFMFRKKRAA